MTRERIDSHSQLHRWVSVAMLCGASAACGSPPDAQQPTEQSQQTEEETPIERYFPLRNGTIYQYTTAQPNGKPGVFVLSIVREDDHATLTAGNTVQHLEILGSAIRNEAGHYQLKMPLTVGNSWQGQSGTVRIKQAHLSVTVEAGSFTDCIETEEQTQATVEVRTTRATYCPGVGLVSLEVESQLGENIARESAKLRYFGPKIDINAL